MRGGKLDKVITIQAFASGVDDYGTPIEAWSDFATVRADRIETSTEEFIRGYGETDATLAIFRVRWLDGVTTKHRVQHDGQNFNIREVKEIGRREGLDLRCEEGRT